MFLWSVGALPCADGYGPRSGPGESQPAIQLGKAKHQRRCGFRTRSDSIYSGTPKRTVTGLSEGLAFWMAQRLGAAKTALDIAVVPSAAGARICFCLRSIRCWIRSVSSPGQLLNHLCKPRKLGHQLLPL